MVRPTTSLTRRRLVEVKVPLPRECFDDFMEPLQEGEAEGVSRDETSGALLPTRVTATTNFWAYVIHRPMVTDRLLKLETSDEGAGPRASERPARKKGAWRRGLGCGRLWLAAGAEKQGKLGNKLSLVAGNLVVEYREPKRWAAMPTLTLRFFVLTMNHMGHIEWPCRFTDRARALLRKLARLKAKEMLDSPEYPADPAMAQALSASSDTFLQLRASPRDPSNLLME